MFERIFNRNSNFRIIYLDHASCAPLDPDVAKTVSLYEQEYFANPSAVHSLGVKAKKILDESRTKVAQLLKAHHDEIVFVGSGTESNALALRGVVNYLKITQPDFVPHIITTSIEHPAILENCRTLENAHIAEITYVGVDKNGRVDPKEIREALKPNTVLVSVMYANNEIGTVQPIQEIAKLIRHYKKRKLEPRKESAIGVPWETDEPSTRNFSPEKYPCTPIVDSLRGMLPDAYPIFHTDACQAMNYLYTENIEKLGVDLLSFNGSKIYGPKGIACLYAKRGTRLAPIYGGGGQEFGLRSGTEDVARIAGLAHALEKVSKIKDREVSRLVNLRDYAIDKILELSEASGFKIIVNGDRVNRLPNNINISILGISSELLVIELSAHGIMVSSRSACKSEEEDESHVIAAIRLAQEVNKPTSNSTEGSLRISMGQKTTRKEIDILLKNLRQILEKYVPYTQL